MSYIDNQTYYGSSSNFGEHQYVSLAEIVNNFMLMYVGPDNLVDNVSRHNILFHTKRAIQELNYDAARNAKVVEMEVGSDLQMIMPPDFVDYVRVSVLVDGQLYPLHQNNKINYATAYQQDVNLDFLFDVDGNVITETSQLDTDRLAGLPQSLYNGPGIYNGMYGWNLDGDWYFGYSIGGFFGMDPDIANQNDSFRINKAAGVINFSSGVAGKRLVLEYISDGLENGDDTSVKVHKFAEEYIYAYVKWAVLNNKHGIQEYIINRARKDKSSLLRNAKIRLSNIKAGRLLMVLRGRDKWIK